MSAHKRIRAVARLVSDRGMNRDSAEVIALALFPLDVGPEGVPVSKRFPGKIARRTKRFRKTARSLAGDVLVDLARDAVEDYYDLAVVCGEAYYITKFGEATAGPAPWVGAVSDAEQADESSASSEIDEVGSRSERR